LKAKELFEFKNWVVIGSTTKTDKYAYKILNALKNADFNVVGVSPTDKTGEAFKSLDLVPYKIDCIDLCINPIIGMECIKKAKELGIDKILIQPGAQSIEILTYCKENNITAIQDCALVQLRLLK
jgi:predicted CoA-binding protein